MSHRGTSGAEGALGENTGGPYLTIARIIRPQGRKGEVAAEILTDFPERFGLLSRVFLETPGQAPQPVTVESGWLHKGRVVLKFSGIDSIDSASRLRGLQVFVPGRSVPSFRRITTTSVSCTDAA